MKEFNATNTGNRVVINCANMNEAMQLKNVIFNEIKKSPLGLKLTADKNSILESELDIASILEFIKNILLSIDSSEAFEEAIFNCLRHCTYKSTFKIDKDLFDNQQVQEAREDYYEIVYYCVEENLRPFFKSLVSVWKILLQNNTIAQVLNVQ